MGKDGASDSCDMQLARRCRGGVRTSFTICNCRLHDSSGSIAPSLRARAEALAHQAVLLDQLVQRAAILLRNARRHRDVAGRLGQKLTEIRLLELSDRPCFGAFEG